MLTREYNQLLAAGANPIGRRMIVSGLSGIGIDTLLGVADTDPDRGVRGQAIITATWAADFEPNAKFLQRLREGHAWNDSPVGIPPYATISTAQNLLQRAKQAGDDLLAADTIQFLRELALDPSVPTCDRDKVPGILQNHMPSAEWEAFRASLPAEGDK